MRKDTNYIIKTTKAQFVVSNGYDLINLFKNELDLLEVEHFARELWYEVMNTTLIIIEFEEFVNKFYSKILDTVPVCKWCEIEN